MLQRMDLFRRRPYLERRLQRWDRLMLREPDDDVQRFDAPRKVGLAGGPREQVVQGAGTAELLQRPRDDGAKSGLGRAQIIDQAGMVGRAVHLGQERCQGDAQRGLRPFQRLHERPEQGLVRVLVDQPREHH